MGARNRGDSIAVCVAECVAVCVAECVAAPCSIREWAICLK